MAVKKELALTEMLLCINTGKTYSETLAQLSTSLHIAKRTFDNYWKEAKERHREDQEAKRNRIAYKTDQADNEALKRGVIERIERLEILTSIARGEAQAQIIPGEQPVNLRTTYVFPNQTERQKAIDQLTRMGEGYSPIKKDFQIDSNRDFEINITD